jgi:para-nitrobenzyl esterase
MSPDVARRGSGRHSPPTRRCGYRFDWPSAHPELGACHAIDIPFPFDAVGRHGWQDFVAQPDDAHALARTVQQLWASFARGQEPTAPGVAHWPRYTTSGAAARTTLALDRHSQVHHDVGVAEGSQ